MYNIFILKYIYYFELKFKKIIKKILKKEIIQKNQNLNKNNKNFYKKIFN